MNFMAIWQWNHHPTRNTTGPRDHSPWLRTGPRKSRCEGNSKGRLTCTMGHGEQEQYQPTKKSPWIIGEWVTWENIYMPFFWVERQTIWVTEPWQSAVKTKRIPHKEGWRTNLKILKNHPISWEWTWAVRAEKLQHVRNSKKQHGTYSAIATETNITDYSDS
jgi:hypothetical protein